MRQYDLKVFSMTTQNLSSARYLTREESVYTPSLSRDTITYLWLTYQFKLVDQWTWCRDWAQSQAPIESDTKHVCSTKGFTATCTDAKIELERFWYTFPNCLINTNIRNFTVHADECDKYSSQWTVRWFPLPAYVSFLSSKENSIHSSSIFSLERTIVLHLYIFRNSYLQHNFKMHLLLGAD